MRWKLQAVAGGSAATLVLACAVGATTAQAGAPRLGTVTAEASWAQATEALPPGSSPDWADQLTAITITLTVDDPASNFKGVCKTDEAKPTSAVGATAAVGGKAEITGLLSGTTYHCFTSEDGTAWSEGIKVSPVASPYALKLSFDQTAWDAIPQAEGWGPMYKAGVDSTTRTWTWPIASVPSASTQLWGATYVKILTAKGFPTKLNDGASPVVQIKTSLGTISFITTKNVRGLNGGWVADAMLTDNALLGTYLPTWKPFLGQRIGTLTLEKSETPAPAPVTAPGTVASLSGKTVGKKGKPATVTFNWQAPVDNGGADVTGYEYVVTVGKTKQPAVTTTTTQVVVRKVQPGVRVSIEVRAVNSVGAGAPAVARVTVRK